jgi:hypothetical protein
VHRRRHTRAPALAYDLAIRGDQTLPVLAKFLLG